MNVDSTFWWVGAAVCSAGSLVFFLVLMWYLVIEVAYKYFGFYKKGFDLMRCMHRENVLKQESDFTDANDTN